MKGLKLKVPYQNFFIKSEEGRAFVAELDRLIESMHERAENNADASRDFTQQAKGVRQVKEHILSVTTEIKKGKPL